MRESLIDLLGCPVCEAAPLALSIFRAETRPVPAPQPHRRMVDSAAHDVVDGILRCPRCARWFPVREGIPDLVRDGLREGKQEREFLAGYRGQIPEGIRDGGGPWGLEGPVPSASGADERVRGEGSYWGEFMEEYWRVGDRSIFDVRVRSTHPAFYGQGVLEVDDRDRRRQCGLWPDHLAALVFGWMEEWEGSRALDVGCGGGQYGLEAARRGLDVVGFDPSRRALELARLHARDTGAVIDYVRADPAHPPFRPGVFDVLMAKDALHHVPELPAALDRLDALLRPGGLVAVYEHVGLSPRKKRILHRLQMRLIPRIQRRYGTVKPPDILLHESPNEDVGMSRIEPELRRRYTPIRTRRELFLYDEAEQLVLFAFGKRRLPAWAARVAFGLLEKLLLATGEPAEHLTFIGRKPSRHEPQRTA